MTTSQIQVEQQERVLLITLARPERMNAWTPQMAVELSEAVAHANDDASIGAIVLTGAGKGFCAGADMSDTFERRIGGDDPGQDTAGGEGGLPRGLDWVAQVRDAKPMIAAVNGAAVGVGLTMILPCDVIVASDRAKFGMFFVKVGLVPELASTHFLVQRMGFGRASEMCLSGRLYGAAEAVEKGLADHLVPHEALLEKSLAIAREIAGNPAPQLRMIKQLLTRNGSATDLRDIQRSESALLRECWKSPEHHAAVRAFLEKARRRRG
jgi:enoyl-CoA hydratase/carnithine racemase